MSSRQLYIGLMSGTSIDGIDAALVDMASGFPKVIDFFTQAYSSQLASRLHQLCAPQANEIVMQGQVDVQLAYAFSDATQTMLNRQSLQASDIIAVGSHGQTIRHHPEADFPFTLQIGDANTLAVKTGIDVVADFRRKDMALGGQGAPLVPAFHQAVFADKKHRAIVNIGGIANITWLPANDNTPVLGFDTGPGNRLMDAWICRHTTQTYDENGDWAKTGSVSERLLKELMSHPYLTLPVPKSTGREVFHLDWLDSVIRDIEKQTGKIKPEDVQRTLLAFTCESIYLHLSQLAGLEAVYVCGGGAQNALLMQTLQSLCNTIPVSSTNTLGLDADAVEAAAFAWLAYAFKHQIPGNMPSVTGASRPAILGALYPALS